MEKFPVCALLTIFFVLFQDVAALKCYVCNSKQDKNCLNPEEETSHLELTDCTTDMKQRMETRQAIEKISEMLQKLGSPSIQLSSDKSPAQIWENEKFPMACQKLEIEVQGDRIVGRGCSAPRMDGFDPCAAVKLITSDDIVLQSCSICDTDGCNSAVPVLGSAIMALVAPAVLLWLTT